MRGKDGNRLVPCLDYTVHVIKLSNEAPRVSGASLQTCVAWRCPDGTHTSSVGQFRTFLLMCDTKITNMPVKYDYLWDFIGIFDDGRGATLTSKMPEQNQRNQIARN
ncbi:hypothetical protein TNCV_2500901 [Trichonephila clavipes]|nr:hypothetical protein TNCV_2500901 [Trichonephila clavipes]